MKPNPIRRAINEALTVDNATALQQLVIDAGDEELQRVSFGGTWLHQAAYYGKLASIEVFIDVYGGVDTKPSQHLSTDRVGTPLHEAAAGNQPEAARLLLGLGADVNALDKHGCTPLITAAAYDSGRTAEVLLEAGADREIRSQTDPPLTAEELARKRGSATVLQALNITGKGTEAGVTGGLVTRHLAEALGAPRAQGLAEVVPSDVPITARVIDPEDDDDYPTLSLFTEGLSEVALPNRDHRMAAQFAELVISLPSDWPIDDDLTDEAVFWPIRWLRWLAHSGIDGRFPLGSGVLVKPSEGPLGPNTPMTHLLLVEDDLADRLTLADGRMVVPLRLLLLHPSEAEYIERIDADPNTEDTHSGLVALMHLYEEKEVHDFFYNPTRPPIV